MPQPRTACINVPYGSLADILTVPLHVRFTPNNGRWAAHPSQHLAVGLGVHALSKAKGRRPKPTGLRNAAVKMKRPRTGGAGPLRFLLGERGHGREPITVTRTYTFEKHRTHARLTFVHNF